jgi:triacylglycerol lipase
MKTLPKTFFKIISSLTVLLALNIRFICAFLFYTGCTAVLFPRGCAITEILCILLLLYIHIFPTLSTHKISSFRNKILEDGTALLQIFLTTTILETACCLTILALSLSGSPGAAPLSLITWIRYLLTVFLVELTLFWNGILRVYLTSVQLGIKWRIIGIACGCIPIVHIYVLCRIIHITDNEAQWENEKYLLNQVRAENQECRTKYPLLLIHGVFFRDFRFFNYWGRIPAELKKNGAILFYGSQQSAASVAECGQELAERIRQILAETGCGKVNIIAHSKGGLDSRYAISRCGIAPYVASLTTINTPHRGCIFADYLLQKIPDSIRRSVAAKYNAALKKFGDSDPDFMEAVQDLTASSCMRLNELLPDDPQVYYQSAGTRMHRAAGGRFPLNMSYPLVKHFDGECDGLVSLDSMKWGSHFICPDVPGGRGISHGDMIDLNRENISGFDVREFYVGLVHNLKEMGL